MTEGSDFGILLDRQGEDGENPRQHDDNGDDPGKNRAVDEKLGHDILILILLAIPDLPVATARLPGLPAVRQPPVRRH